MPVLEPQSAYLGATRYNKASILTLAHQLAITTQRYLFVVPTEFGVDMLNVFSACNAGNCQD